MRKLTSTLVIVTLGLACVSSAQQGWQPKTPLISSLDEVLRQTIRTILPGLGSESTYHIYPEGGWYTHHWTYGRTILHGEKLAAKVVTVMQNSRQFLDLKFTPVNSKNCLGRLRGTMTYYQSTFNNSSQAYTAFIFIDGSTGSLGGKPFGSLDISVASYPPGKGEPCQK